MSGGGWLGVATPEAVSINLPIAGIGFRAMAYLIDAALLGSAGLIVYFVFTLAVADPLEMLLGLGVWLRAGLGFAGFAALWAYWTVLEVVWHGQTVGKRVMRIRVVRKDGSPVTFFESAVRNVLRLIDFLPLCYPVGVVTMLVDANHRRLGDLAAGTVLVREEKLDLLKYAEASITTTLSASELELLTDFLSRFEGLDAEARLRLGRTLAAKLGAHQASAFDEGGVRAFLRARLAAG